MQDALIPFQTAELGWRSQGLRRTGAATARVGSGCSPGSGAATTCPPPGRMQESPANAQEQLLRLGGGVGTVLQRPLLRACDLDVSFLGAWRRGSGGRASSSKLVSRYWPWQRWCVMDGGLNTADRTHIPESCVKITSLSLSGRKPVPNTQRHLGLGWRGARWWSLWPPEVLPRSPQTGEAGPEQSWAKLGRHWGRTGGCVQAAVAVGGDERVGAHEVPWQEFDGKATVLQ